MSTDRQTEPDYDLEFFWDPVCPFAWITSRWVVKVAQQTGYRVDWRFISLRLLNKAKNYATDFPEGYEHGHTAGLRQLRVAAAVRAELGREPLGALVTAFGEHYFDQPKGSELRDRLGTVPFVHDVLTSAGLPTRFATAVNEPSWDNELDAETELALSRTGRDVGTPIITVNGGLSFFGPVISRVPSDEEAVPLWEAVTRLAAFPGFAELKRSLRERPQLRLLGFDAEPQHEDWRAGARAGHRPDDRP